MLTRVTNLIPYDSLTIHSTLLNMQLNFIVSSYYKTKVINTVDNCNTIQLHNFETYLTQIILQFNPNSNRYFTLNTEKSNSKENYKKKKIIEIFFNELLLHNLSIIQKKIYIWNLIYCIFPGKNPFIYFSIRANNMSGYILY